MQKKILKNLTVQIGYNNLQFLRPAIQAPP